MRLRLLLVLLLAVLPGTALAQHQEEPVKTPVQASEHPDRYRLAIAFRDRPDHAVQIEGRNLILEFERPVLLDFGPARSSLGDLLGEPTVSSFGRRYSIPLGDVRRVSDVVVGSSLLLDFFPPPPPPPPPPVIAYGLPFEHFDRLVFSFVENVSATLESAEGKALLRFSKPGALDAEHFALDGLKLVRSAQARLLDEALEVEINVEPGSHFHLRDRGEVIELDVARSVLDLQRDEALVADLDAEPALPGLPLAAPLHAGPTRVPLGEELRLEVSRPESGVQPPTPGRAASWPAPLAVSFDWQEPTGLAALVLDQQLLLVFDRPAPEELVDALRAADASLAGVRRLPVSGATALLMPLNPPLSPSVERVEGGWRLDLRPREAGAPLGPPYSRREGDEGPELRIGVPGGQRVVDLDLPEAGGRLLLVPLSASGQAIPQALRLPQATVLRTLQGVAVRPLADDLRVAVDAAGVTLGAEEGLLLSTVEGGYRGGGGSWREGRQARLPLFDLPTWRLESEGSFEEIRQQLQDAVLAVDRSRKGLARLRLARFLFAHGLGAETVAALRLLEQDDPALAADPEVQLMLGVALLLDGRAAEASALLSAALLDDESEAWLWRAALAAEARDWELADSSFQRAQDHIPAYSRGVRARLRLDAAEAALESYDPERTWKQLDLAALDVATRPEETRLAYLRGRASLLEDEETTARGQLQRAADGTPTAAGIRARLLLLDLDLREGELTPAEAVEQLEQLRFAWRGDAFEFEIVRQLADAQWQAGKVRESLRHLRQAVAMYPEARGAEAAAADLADRFREATLTATEQGMSPLSALALYEEFRELTPAGEDGERLIAGLSERLIEMDLLDRAASLLEHQVDFRLRGEAKAKAGTELAHVLLLDQRPRDALLALGRSAAPDLPPELAAQRRLLRARGLAGSGRLEQATALLEQEEDPAAAELRADLLWEGGRWGEAARALEGLLPAADGDGLDERAALRLLRAGVAYTLSGEVEAVVQLRRAYGPQLEGGPFEEIFSLLADSGGTDSLAAELAAVERARAFMAQYRADLAGGAIGDAGD